VKPCSLHVLIALTALITSLSAEDLPPTDPKTLLKQLDQLASDAQHQLQSRRSAALSRVQPAASSGDAAVDAYLHALENTQYKESAKDFLEWRKKKSELLRSKEFQTALQLQLRYLCIALQRTEQHDAFAQVPDTLSYLSLLGAFESGIGGSGDKQNPEVRTILQEPLQNSSIVEWLQIADLIPSGKDFADSPGNYQEIMDQNIREPLQAKKDPRLPGTWDAQISVEAAIATGSGSQQQVDAFNQTELPNLLFKQAQDTAGIGQPNRAIADILKLIQSFPGDPDMKEWVDYARGLISPPAPTSTPQIPTPPPLPFPFPSTTPGAAK